MKGLFRFTFQKQLFYFPLFVALIILFVLISLGEIQITGNTLFDDASTYIYDGNEVLLDLFTGLDNLTIIYVPLFFLFGIHLMQRMEHMGYLILRHKNRHAWSGKLLGVSILVWITFMFFYMLSNFILVHAFFPFKNRRTIFSDLLKVPKEHLAAEYIPSTALKFGLCLLAFLWLYILLRFLFEKKGVAIAVILFYLAANIAYPRLPYIPFFSQWLAYSMISCVKMYHPMGLWLLIARICLFGLGIVLFSNRFQFKWKEVRQ